MQYPFLDSLILSKYLAINAGKYNFNRMHKMLFRGLNYQKEIMPYNITGVKMELAGRLVTQRSIPRKTVSKAEIDVKTNKCLKQQNTMTQYTSKNKLGSFTIKV